MKRSLPLLLLALLFAGCASPSKTLASWVGHNSNELLASWGPPDEVFSNGEGGQVFIYTRTREFTQPGTATTTYSSNTNGILTGGLYSSNTYGTATTTFRPGYTQSYTAYRMFFIDSSGTIYSWAWRGL
jgi:hypothetical protein